MRTTPPHRQEKSRRTLPLSECGCHDGPTTARIGPVRAVLKADDARQKPLRP